MTKKIEKLYIVVVHNPKGSLRDDRSHSCWTGTDKKALIEQACIMKRKWEASGKYGPYEIVVGEITEKVVFPSVYRIEKYILWDN